MQIRLPPQKVLEVIILFLRGYPVQNIHKITGVSTGAISNICSHFLDKVNVDPVYVRYLLKELKKANVDLRNLAMAFRLNNMLPFLGIIDEEDRTNLESFVLTIYNTCMERN